jgi:phosphoribosylglycinamide formyltransferase-1
MRALLDAGLPVSAVISNRADAEGLALAAARGVATRVVEHRGHATREGFDAALALEIDRSPGSCASSHPDSSRATAAGC